MSQAIEPSSMSSLRPAMRTAIEHVTLAYNWLKEKELQKLLGFGFGSG